MLDMTTSHAPKGMFIGGRWTQGSGTFEDLNPSDGSVWATVPDGGRAEAAQAIDAAHAAFPAWAELPFVKRAEYLLKIAEIWERRSPDFIAAMQAEGGGWFGKGMFETGYVADVFRAAAASTYQPIGEVLPSEPTTRSRPPCAADGRVSVISPWNFPGILTVARLRLSAGRRQHHRPETVRGHALLRRALSSPRSSKKRASRRARSTSSPARATRRRDGRRTDREPAREGHLLHRLHRRGPPSPRRPARI
jgi:hypothetical protein